MKTRAQWLWDTGFRHVGQTVHERKPRPDPLLYAPTGEPLVEAKPPVGFKRPERGAK